jgi:hypothetical protein
MTSPQIARREWLTHADHAVTFSLELLADGCPLVSAAAVLQLRETTQTLMFRIAIARRMKVC